MFRVLVAAAMIAAVALAGNDDDLPPDKAAEDAAKAISKTLRSHMTLPTGSGWPDFQMRIVNEIDKSPFGFKAGWEDWGDDKPTPYIAITRSYLAAFKDHPDSLAFLFARELGRLQVGAVVPPRMEALGGACTMRRLDASADSFACKLLMQSGYSITRAVLGIRLALDRLPEGFRPALKEHVAHINDWLSSEDEPWRQSPLFRTGIMFLAAEHYGMAKSCFELLALEFPRSAEVWTYRACIRLKVLAACFDLDRKREKLPELTVVVADGKKVKLRDDLDEVLSRLGKPTRVTHLAGLASRWRGFTPLGIEILSDEDDVAAILMVDSRPRIKFPAIEGKAAPELRVGMKRKDVESLPGGTEFVPHLGIANSDPFATHPGWNIVVFYDGDGPDAKVTQVLLHGPRPGEVIR